jgi:predicted dehydrogenase
MASKSTIHVALIGAGFMGKSHSNAYSKVNKFFDLPARVVMHTMADMAGGAARAMADRWGWQNATDDAMSVIGNPEIDLVDICTPNNTHAKYAIAAAAAGKAVACEKPLAHTLADATAMADAVRKARVPNFVWFNYRRCPAVALARQLIEQGRIGQIYHVRASYLQDWIMDPSFPLVWRLKKEVTGSGAHGDLNAHIIDLARYLVGEFDSVVGHMETFIRTRPLEAGRSVRGLEGKGAAGKTGRVTVVVAAIFLARFHNGALGTFEATRFAKGRKNRNQFEINGSKGTVAFNFERMNELEFFDATAPAHVQGFTTILATEPIHPYAGAYWPPGHLIGYEHGAINELSDIVTALAGGKKKPDFHPDFADGLACQKVLEAVERSHKSRTWVKLSSVK